MAYINNTTRRKQQKIEQQQLAKRTTIMSFVMVFATIIAILYELLASLETFKFATGQTSGAYDGVVIVYYYLPLIYALPVFILIDCLSLYFIEGIKYVSRPDRTLRSYVAYLWSQFLLFAPVIAVILSAKTMDLHSAGLAVTIVSFIAMAICIVAFFVNNKALNKRRMQYLPTAFAILTIIEIIAWIYCGLMNGLA